MSSYKSLSYLWVDDLSTEGTQRLFSRAKQIKNNIASKQIELTLSGQQVAFIFSEASTRTKMSFQMAAQRLGAQCLVIDDVTSSSMSKGETFSDTFWTLHAMRPDLFVVRCGDHEPLDLVAQTSGVPVINAGFGKKSHPTQALLDCYTLLEHFGKLDGLRVVIVGDIDHSRVATSGIELLRAFGADVKICAPANFCKNKPNDLENIPSLSEAISWCDVYMGLRVQFERHTEGKEAGFAKQDFINKFSLNQKGLDLMNKKTVIMHPGPVNWGVEFDSAVQSDGRLLMWKQKENGVYTRAALMEHVLKVGR